MRSLAVLTGSAESVRAVPDLDALAGLVDLGEISRAPARFDPAELDGLNARLIHAMPYREAAARLADLGIPEDRAEAFWLAVRANLSRVPEAAPWWRVVTGPVEPVLTEPAVIAAAVESLPPSRSARRPGRRGRPRSGLAPAPRAAACSCRSGSR